MSAVLTQLPWTHNLIILSQSKRPEEREFYLHMATQHRWQVREVARQIDNQLFAKTVFNPTKVSTTLREIHPKVNKIYFIFLNSLSNLIRLK